MFFKKPSDFRKWLEKNHQKETELLVGFYKVKSGQPSMTWSQSVDEALCFGWIDSIRRSIDDESYSIRFTPRRTDSIWSAVNIKKMEVLIAKGRMQKAGLDIYQHRTENKSKIYSFEKEEEALSPDLEEELKANKTAWQYFQSLAPSYRKAFVHWVMNAKQKAITRKRFDKLLMDCQAGTNQWKDNKYSKK